MPQVVPNPPPGFDEMSVAEQIEYVQALWDRIAASAEAVPIPESHRKELERRLRAHEANPDAARPWSEVREELYRKLEQRRATE